MKENTIKEGLIYQVYEIVDRNGSPIKKQFQYDITLEIISTTDSRFVGQIDDNDGISLV
jgi:hypothetical protein